MSREWKLFIVAPSIAMGGIERAAVNTANGLHAMGYPVIFLSLFKKGHFFTLNEGISLIEPTGFNEKSLKFLKSVLWIRSEIGKHQPSHVIVFNKLYGALTAMALIGMDVPLFISERSSPLFRWKFPLNMINRFAYTMKAPRGVIAQTQIAADHQIKYFKRSTIVVIPNSVREVNLYPDISREKIILAVGRLNDHLKGFDLLLEAIALLKNQNWELHIAGGDEEGESLKKLASELGISHRVKFLGKIKDIDMCYARSGIFVIPSRSEGFPNAMCEAMAAGLPCISFDFIAGPRDIINNNVDGIIVQNGNIKEMAEKINFLISNETERKRLGKNAMKIRDRLHFDKIGKMYEDLIFGL